MSARYAAARPPENGRAMWSLWTTPAPKLPGKWGFKPMESSHSGSAKPLYVMPDELRHELGAPVGKIFTDIADIINEIETSRFIVTVGDIVTLDILEAGVIPDISIIDYMTKRMPMDQVKERFDKFSQPEISVKNPMAQITHEMWNAIKDGYDNSRNLRIIVDGEEDLAALACIVLAPPGTTVIYGIPNRGASIHHVDADLKQLVSEVLKKMELK